MTGTIQAVKSGRYGFIRPDGRSKDVFFHADDLIELVPTEALEGMQVAFDVESSPKGDRAVRVRPLN